MIGQILNGNRIEEKICVATTGTVYRAKDVLLEVDRAVKIIHPKMVNPVTRTRLQAAVQFWAQLDHPNFVHIFSSIEDGQTLGFVMDYIQGNSLRQLLKNQSKLGISQAIDYFIQLAKGLSFAHSQHILHRKLSPENVIVRSDETIKIMGLGVLKHETQPRNITPTNLCIGKPSYMAPEQFKGQYSIYSDQYIWGAMLYEMVTGKAPFVADNIRNLVRLHMQQQPVPPSSLNSEIKPELESIILKTLAKRPEQRFPNMAKLLEALMAATDRLDEAGDVSAQSLMYRGRHAMERRRIEHAIYFFNKVLSLYGKETPYFKEAYEKRTNGLRLWQEEESIKKVRTLYTETLACFDNEDQDGTRAHILGILQIMRDHPDSSRIRGTKMDVMREVPDLLAETANKLEQQIEESRKLTEKGKLLLDDGQNDEAISILNQALEKDGKNEQALLLKNLGKRRYKMVLMTKCFRDGVSAMKNGHYAQSSSFFEKVLELKPNHEQALKHLKVVKREEELEKTRRLQIGKYYQEGLELYEQWLPDQALEKFKKVLELAPEHQEAKGFVNAVQNRLDEDSKLEEIGFFYQKGMNFYNNKKWREAIACFTHVLKEMGTHKKALGYRKLAQEALEQQDGYDKMLEEAMVLFRGSQYSEALKRFECLYKLDTSNQELGNYRRLCREFLQQS